MNKSKLEQKTTNKPITCNPASIAYEKTDKVLTMFLTFGTKNTVKILLFLKLC